MYLGMIHAGSHVYVGTVNGVNTPQHASADAAKASLADYIARNKASFQNGYTAYVIDQSTQKVVSVATIPQPTLEWKDS